MVAPIVRWGKEVWAAQYHQYLGGMTHKELRRCWSSVFEGKLQPKTWRSVAGPISALFLSVKRI
eukprot:9229278-Pyramimonas_sp.AAC.1